jgi:hypothetical protein
LVIRDPALEFPLERPDLLLPEQRVAQQAGNQHQAGFRAAAHAGIMPVFRALLPSLDRARAR